MALDLYPYLHVSGEGNPDENGYILAFYQPTFVRYAQLRLENNIAVQSFSFKTAIETEKEKHGKRLWSPKNKQITISQGSSGTKT